ncbi:oxysterol-binding protein-related protein 9-like [Saccostrea echinata]|uniref:oxysterol-binding protein-related protein 9-like n=1 Tax=Saccostrea echinata TaxID=191078 RepID=UPI002A833B91|nr:oxysterol-binding protein-related protein 9-like [Saccostrea echinata]
MWSALFWICKSLVFKYFDNCTLARDAEEREKWVNALENTILRHSSAGKRVDQRDSVTAEDFDRKLAETDAYLQIMLDQVQALETRIEACEDLAAKEKYNVIKVTAEAMIEAIKHSIVMLQISKESLNGPVMNGSVHEAILTTGADFNHFGATGIMSEADLSSTTSPISPRVPETSYSSSEDEEFFEAEEFKHASSSPLPQHADDKSENATKFTEGEETEETETSDGGRADCQQVIKAEDDYYDELYDEQDKEDLGSLEKHGSIIAHLLSQVRIGMDLTKVVLPTFILERRSLLEMYADFFAHPDLFVKIVDMKTPQDRMIQLVRWYLSAFHAARNSDIAKKAYNPILGETFKCHWKIPGMEAEGEKAVDGPCEEATNNNLAFVAEQVSHHPPISAFYAEHKSKRITLDGYIWTKSKFLGLSIGVHMIGQGVVSVIDHDEEYVITFPNGYGRSILTTPWVEMGGKVTMSCAKTGYNATVTFHTKPFYGGKKHRVTSEIFAPNEKKPLVTIDGEWNGVMYAKHATGMNEVFVDTKRMPVVKKLVKPREKQGEFESRRLWQDVTYSLKYNEVDKATEFKQRLEQRQREEARERKERGVSWETKNFHEVGEHWVYDKPLQKRLKNASPVSSNSHTPNS